MSSNLTRDAVSRLKPYIPGKPIDEVKRELGLTDVIKLASNENPLGASPKALAAMREAIKTTRLYPDNECFELKRALSERLGFPPNQIIIGRGSDEVIHMLGIAFLRPGDEVLMPSNPFVLYEFTSDLMEAELVRVPLKDYRYDLAAMAERLTPRTKLVFLANPNNPTGTIVSQQEVEKFIARMGENTILVMDEAYYEYAENPDYPRSLEFVRQGKNVVVLRTFSKIYALAGLRVGYGVANEELSAALNQVREPFNVSGVAQAAALASLSDPKQVERSVRVNNQGKKYLYKELRKLKKLGVQYVPTQANFIFVDTGQDGQKVAFELLKHGIIVRFDPAFKYPSCFRVTVGTREQNKRFMGAMEEIIKAL
jgi:histidinol-phosphate aminotransferase